MDQDQTNQPTTIDEDQLDADLDALLTEAKAIVDEHDAAAAKTAEAVEADIAALDGIEAEVTEITDDLTALENETADQLDALILEQAAAFGEEDDEDAADDAADEAEEAETPAV